MRAALISFLLLAGIVEAADEDKEYYPLKIGTIWTYKVGAQADRLTITAVNTEKVGTQECVKLEAKLKGQVIGSECNAILKDGVYRFKFSDDAVEPPICFFKATGKKGETWKQDYKNGDVKGASKFEMDVEDVEVPAGKFKGALVVRVEAAEMDVVTKTTIWYAKNHGMVKQVVKNGDSEIVIELEKFEEAKK